MLKINQRRLLNGKIDNHNFSSVLIERLKSEIKVAAELFSSPINRSSEGYPSNYLTEDLDTSDLTESSPMDI